MGGGEDMRAGAGTGRGEYIHGSSRPTACPPRPARFFSRPPYSFPAPPVSSHAPHFSFPAPRVSSLAPPFSSRSPTRPSLLRNVFVLAPRRTAAFANLDGHGARDDVARGQVLGDGGVLLHEALAEAVEQVAALAAGALGDEAPGAVDAGRVELDKLHVLEREARARDHGVAVARAGVRGRARKVGAAVAAGGEDGLVRAEAVQAAVLHVERHHADALALVHDEVERKVLDEEGGVVLERLAVQRVQDGVARAVGGRRAPVRLAVLAVVERLAAKGALVDLALVRARERHAVVLQLDHRARRLAAHVVDRVLVAQPVAALDRVVHVPPPVVLAHVAQRRVHTALRRRRVRARREELGDARHVEALLGEPKGRAQAGAASAHDNRVVLVVDDRVRLGASGLGGRTGRIEEGGRARAKGGGWGGRKGEGGEGGRAKRGGWGGRKRGGRRIWVSGTGCR